MITVADVIKHLGYFDPHTPVVQKEMDRECPGEIVILDDLLYNIM